MLRRSPTRPSGARAPPSQSRTSRQRFDADVATTNPNPTPFTRSKTAEQIIKRVERGRGTRDTITNQNADAALDRDACGYGHSTPRSGAEGQLPSLALECSAHRDQAMASTLGLSEAGAIIDDGESQPLPRDDVE